MDQTGTVGEEQVEGGARPDSGTAATASPAPIVIPVKRLTMLLAIVAAVLAVVSLASAIGTHIADRDVLTRIDLDSESSIPAWFQSMLLLLIGLLLAAVSQAMHSRGERYARRYLVLAVAFAVAAVDEAVALHEILIEPLRDALGTGGVLHFAWVIPGAAVVAFFAAMMIAPIRALPRRVRWSLLLAAGIYLGGALGMEFVGGVEADSAGTDTLTYRLMTQFEEWLEMAGLLLFVHTLAAWFATVSGALVLRHGGDRPAAR